MEVPAYRPGGPLYPMGNWATAGAAMAEVTATGARTYFGRAAVFEYMDGAEGRFMRALKSILGTSLMKETTQVGRNRMTFEGLIGRYLRHLREGIEGQEGGVPEAVTVPDGCAGRTLPKSGA